MTAAWYATAGPVLDRRRQRPNSRSHRPERRSATDLLSSTDHLRGTVYRRPLATHYCHTMSSVTDNGFYFPNSGIEIERNFPPVLGWGPPIFDSSFALHFGLFFSLAGRSFVKGVVCLVKNKGEVLITTLSKLPPPIFHWAQAAPTRYKDRSHW